MAEPVADHAQGPMAGANAAIDLPFETFSDEEEEHGIPTFLAGLILGVTTIQQVQDKINQN
jgi:hypothetical protein